MEEPVEEPELELESQTCGSCNGGGCKDESSEKLEQAEEPEIEEGCSPEGQREETSMSDMSRRYQRPTGALGGRDAFLVRVRGAEGSVICSLVVLKNNQGAPELAVEGA